MTEREMYLRMADWFRVHGFSPDHRRDDCGCFLAAKFEVADDTGCRAPPLSYGPLEEIVHGHRGGDSFGAELLRGHGWTGPEATDDAVAACLIAADLAA